MYTKQSPIPKILKRFSGFFIYGHRGLSKHRSENTMSSFSYAIKANVNGIELDVQKIKGGELIVFHDENLSRVNGRQKPISEYSYSEIKNIDITKKWDKIKNQSIPQLVDILKLIPKNLMLNIEIKSYKSSQNNIIYDIMDLIEKYDLYDNIIVSSFNPFMLFKIKKLNNKIPIAIIWNGRTKFIKMIVRLLKPSTFHMHHKYINPKIINWMHKRNTMVFAYTVNNKEDYLKAKNCNLDGVFTDVNLFTIKHS